MAEEILIDIKLEKGDNEKQVDLLTQKITGLTKANADLNKQNKELLKTGQENSKEYLENSKQIEINKQKITESQAARKGLIATIITEDNSIKSLQVQNANLIKQRNSLNTSTQEGRDKIAELNAQIDKNNETINENSSALEKQRFNIGNYKSALDGIVPGLGGFIDGIQGATKAGLAFIATPIGLVLAAVAGALFTVMTYFKRTEEGEDKLNKVIFTTQALFGKLADVATEVGRFLVSAFENPRKAITDFANLIKENIVNRFEGLIELIPQLGKAIELLFKGEFVEAGKVAADAVIKVGTGIENASDKIRNFANEISNTVDDAIKSGERLSQLDMLLGDQEEALTVNRARIGLQVAKLREEALKVEGDSRKKYIEEAIALEKRLSEEEVEFAKTKFEIAKEEQRVNGLTGDSKQAVAEAQAAVINAEATAFSNTLRFQKQLASLAEEELRNKQKLADEEIKINKEIEAAEKEQFESNLKVIEENGSIRLKAIQENYLNELISKEEFEAQFTNLEFVALEERKAFLVANGESTAAIEEQIILKQIAQKEKQFAAEKAIDAARIANEKAITNAKIGIAAQAGNLLQQLAGKNKSVAITGVVIEKAAALAQIIANTAIANSKSVAASPLTAGMPWVAINTASGILSGLSVVSEAAQSISAINNAKFARGGIARTGGVLRGPLHRDGGIPFSVGGVAGFEAEGNEAIINRRSTAMFRPLLSAINEAGGGVKFAGGGMTTIGSSQTRLASQQAISQSGIRELTQAVLNRPTIVTVEDINAKQDEVFVTENRAIVI